MIQDIHPILHSHESGPFWVISNLSFGFNFSSRHLLQKIESANGGLRHFIVQSNFDVTNIQSKSAWGLIPVFQNTLPESAIDHFFDEILQCNLPVLTLHVDRTNFKEKQILPLDINPDVRFGKLMSPNRLAGFANGKELKTYVKSKLKFFELAKRSFDQRKPIIDINKFDGKYSWLHISKELDMLDDLGCCLLKRGKFNLYLTKFNELAAIPNEIGRLRALTFEEIGEGTGKTLDLDEFDQTYYQLFLVDMEAKCLVGGYRIGACDELIATYGISGLYTHQLYRINPQIEEVLSKSIELGRSFVIQSYQKKKLPLFLLWNGILKFIQLRKQYKYILGMVSISRAYSDVSRSLIISYLKRHHYDKEIAGYFTPRQEYYSSSSRDKLETIIKVFNGELIHLDEFIAEIEPENYRLPVLIRKYINQNACFIGFNLDPSFSYCVDGLMLLDIDKLPATTVQLLEQK